MRSPLAVLVLFVGACTFSGCADDEPPSKVSVLTKFEQTCIKSCMNEVRCFNEGSRLECEQYCAEEIQDLARGVPDSAEGMSCIQSFERFEACMSKADCRSLGTYYELDVGNYNHACGTQEREVDILCAPF